MIVQHKAFTLARTRDRELARMPLTDHVRSVDAGSWAAGLIGAAMIAVMVLM